MEKDIYKALGNVTRGYRLQLGWSQEELGERAGLHASYIGQIERGVKKVSLATLQKLSVALKVRMAELLEEKPPVYRPSSYETRLAGMIKDRPVEQQALIYRIARETLRSGRAPRPGRKKQGFRR